VCILWTSTYPKGRKSLPGAHIGYLTGFDATNIYHVWVPHLKRIFRARDVGIDETLVFDPANPHLDPLEVDKLIRIIEIPELPMQPKRTLTTCTIIGMT
jgi:hypothetical protein